MAGPTVTTDKTAVLSLINKETGEVRSRVSPSHRRPRSATLSPSRSICRRQSFTPTADCYRQLAHELHGTRMRDHHGDEYVRGDVSTEPRPRATSRQLKRSIDGTHHHVSRSTWSHLAEFDYRHTTRKLTDTAQMRKLMGQVGGRRLTYRPVTK